MFARSLLVLSLHASITFGQDSAKVIEKQKATAAEMMKKAGVAKPTMIETGDLIVYSSFPEAKTKMVREAWDVHVSKHTVATTVSEIKVVLGEYGSWITCR